MMPLPMWGWDGHHRPWHPMTPTWEMVTGPSQEPISLTEAKQHARITHSNDDGLLRSYIRTAREAAEQYLGRGLFTQTWRLTLGAFAETMWLPMAAPLQNDPNATPSTAPIVQYYDRDGALQTLASTVYTVETSSRPGRIVRAPAQAWPALQADRISGRVTITYVVGWTTVPLIPERIKQGIRMYVTYLDADREGLEQYGDQAQKAAERCWTDQVTWIAPDPYVYASRP